MGCIGGYRHSTGFRASGFRELRVRFWGVPTKSISFLGSKYAILMVLWGLFWGPFIYGNYHVSGCYLLDVVLQSKNGPHPRIPSASLRRSSPERWVAVKEHNLCYSSREARSIAIYTHCDNLD